MSAIRPYSLCGWLESDLVLSQYELRKDLEGFMARAIKLSKAF